METESIKNEDIKLCCEYSEEKTKIKEIFKDLLMAIEYKQTGVYFDDDKEQRDIYNITLERKGEKISFTFGQSLADTEIHKKPRAYDILVCVSSDYFCPNSFKDFCSEYGYNEDSIKTQALFSRCKEQRNQLRLIFTEDEAQALPR